MRKLQSAAFYVIMGALAVLNLSVGNTKIAYFNLATVYILALLDGWTDQRFPDDERDDMTW